eukprot:2944586-Rhodomonas_salina.2
MATSGPDGGSEGDVGGFGAFFSNNPILHSLSEMLWPSAEQDNCLPGAVGDADLEINDARKANDDARARHMSGDVGFVVSGDVEFKGDAGPSFRSTQMHGEYSSFQQAKISCGKMMKTFSDAPIVAIAPNGSEVQGTGIPPSDEEQKVTEISCSIDQGAYTTGGKVENAGDIQFEAFNKLAEAMGAVLVRPDGTEVNREEVLKGKYLGLYFSAAWCQPCKIFTPQLVKLYTRLSALRGDFEIVFLSDDRDENAFKKYHN